MQRESLECGIIENLRIRPGTLNRKAFESVLYWREAGDTYQNPGSTFKSRLTTVKERRKDRGSRTDRHKQRSWETSSLDHRDFSAIGEKERKTVEYNFFLSAITATKRVSFLRPQNQHSLSLSYPGCKNSSPSRLTILASTTACVITLYLLLSSLGCKKNAPCDHRHGLDTCLSAHCLSFLSLVQEK